MRLDTQNLMNWIRVFGNKHTNGYIFRHILRHWYWHSSFQKKTYKIIFPDNCRYQTNASGEWHPFIEYFAIVIYVSHSFNAPRNSFDWKIYRSTLYTRHHIERVKWHRWHICRLRCRRQKREENKKKKTKWKKIEEKCYTRRHSFRSRRQNRFASTSLIAPMGIAANAYCRTSPHTAYINRNGTQICSFI